jgi:hypothetical protein
VKQAAHTGRFARRVTVGLAEEGRLSAQDLRALLPAAAVTFPRSEFGRLWAAAVPPLAANPSAGATRALAPAAAATGQALPAGLLAASAGGPGEGATGGRRRQSPFEASVALALAVLQLDVAWDVRVGSDSGGRPAALPRPLPPAARRLSV